MSEPRKLVVREMGLSEVGIRIEYLHGATDAYLKQMGVDRARLASREEFLAFYEADYARPLRERLSYSLVWELDGETVGFSSTDRIVFGKQAFMHLHILSAERRAAGLGTAFVRESAKVYFEVLELERLFCEPNAFNVAPNRTLQRAGFSYLFTHETIAGSINFLQPMTRWMLERSQLDDW
ncbi:MAG: uncharacterized protein JWM85_473 [Acidimicrobiaceae bacterium]|nr:uncharacterized protein [Acidimicrobiaceae bacterium]